MPVSADTVQFSYTGNGVTTVFAFPSRFLLNSDIIVGVDGAQVLTGFTVSGAGNDAGGNVTFATAPANGAIVTLIRAPTISQPLDFVNNQSVLAENLDNGLDRLTIIAQYLDYLLDRTIRLSQFDTTLSGNYDLGGKRVTNSGAPTDNNDLVRVTDVQGLVSNFGNVPLPLIGQVGYLLQALGTGTFGWATGSAVLTALGLTATAAQLNAAGTQLSGRNLVINGSFRINQRNYVSGATSLLADNYYTLDRWQTNAAAPGSFTFTGGNAGRTVTTTGLNNIGQTIEGADIVGGTYVINWVGTGSRINVAGVPRAKGETFTLTAGASLKIDTTGFTGTYTNIQLELGTVPTPFEVLPYGRELERCMRYFYAAPTVNATSNLYVDAARTLMFFRRMTLPVPMRTSPVVTVVGTPTYVNCSNLSVIVQGANEWAERVDTTAAGGYRVTGYSVNFDAEF